MQLSFEELSSHLVGIFLITFAISNVLQIILTLHPNCFLLYTRIRKNSRNTTRYLLYRKRDNQNIRGALFKSVERKITKFMLYLCLFCQVLFPLKIHLTLFSKLPTWCVISCFLELIGFWSNKKRRKTKHPFNDFNTFYWNLTIFSSYV